MIEKYGPPHPRALLPHLCAVCCVDACTICVGSVGMYVCVYGFGLFSGNQSSWLDLDGSFLGRTWFLPSFSQYSYIYLEKPGWEEESFFSFLVCKKYRNEGATGQRQEMWKRVHLLGYREGPPDLCFGPLSPSSAWLLVEQTHLNSHHCGLTSTQLLLGPIA